MVITEYNPEWPVWFKEIRKLLDESIGKYVIGIEHIGSTSIEGMNGKSVIDIDIIISSYDIFEKVLTGLKSIGYEHTGDLGIIHREVFKRVDNICKHGVLDEIDHHLYVCPAKSLELTRHILFRDYLRGNIQAMREYRKIKQEIIAEIGNDNRQQYVEIKENRYKDFFEKIIEFAEKEFDYDLR